MRYSRLGCSVITRADSTLFEGCKPVAVSFGLLALSPVIAGQNQRAIAIAQFESWVDQGRLEFRTGSSEGPMPRTNHPERSVNY